MLEEPSSGKQCMFLGDTDVCMHARLHTCTHGWMDGCMCRSRYANSDAFIQADAHAGGHVPQPCRIFHVWHPFTIHPLPRLLATSS